LGRDAELSAAYRDGLTLPFAKVAALALALLGEITPAAAGPENVQESSLT
jgi:hypothetical protein